MSVEHSQLKSTDIPDAREWRKRWKSVRYPRIEWIRQVAKYVAEHEPSFERMVQVSLADFGASDSGSDDLRFLRRAGLLVEVDGALRLCSQMKQWLESGDDSCPLIGVIHSRIRFIGEILEELEHVPKTVDELNSIADSKYGLTWKRTIQVQRRLHWLELAGLVNRQGSRRAISTAGREVLSRLSVYTPDPSPIEPRYWLMSLGPNARFWDECYESGIACLGWDHLGDLSMPRRRGAPPRCRGRNMGAIRCISSGSHRV